MCCYKQTQTDWGRGDRSFVCVVEVRARARRGRAGAGHCRPRGPRTRGRPRPPPRRAPRGPRRPTRLRPEAAPGRPWRSGRTISVVRAESRRARRCRGRRVEVLVGDAADRLARADVAEPLAREGGGGPVVGVEGQREVLEHGVGLHHPTLEPVVRAVRALVVEDAAVLPRLWDQLT